MFPISDSVKTNKTPFITIILIAINIYVFVRYLLLGNTDGFVEQYALTPEKVNLLNPNTLYPFITSQFLHGGFFHIISNMWFLWVFGDNVEEKIGRIKYLFLYLIAGIAGGFLQYILSPESTIPMLGASGAVSGVLGAYFVLFKHHSIRSIVFLFFVITTVNIPAGIYIFYWFILQLFSGVASIPSLSMETGGVAFFAHVGGFLFGYLIAKQVSKPKKDYIEGEIVE